MQALTTRRSTNMQWLAGTAAVVVSLSALGLFLDRDAAAPSGMNVVRAETTSAPPCRPVTGVFASRLAAATGLTLDDVRVVRDESRVAAWYVGASARSRTGTVPALFATDADPTSNDPQGRFVAVNPVAQSLTDLRSGDSLGFSATSAGGRMALSCITG